MERRNRLFVTALYAAFVCTGFFACGAEKEEGPEHECTSWMVFPDLTKNNTSFLHKNRDALSRNIAVLLSGKDSKRKWIALGNSNPEKTYQSVNMGINASGLAGVMNSGERCTENNTDKTRKGTPAMLRDILENCDTAKEAVARLEQLLAAGDYYHKNSGSIFFFLDTKEGYICENTARYCSSVRYDRGYAFRANIWHNPDLARRSLNSMKGFNNSFTREFVVMSTLNGILSKQGNRLTVADSLTLARTTTVPKDAPNPRSVCFKYTNSSATLVLDHEFPGVLSTGFFNIGQPRHTVCVPVPICTEVLDRRMTDLTWSSEVWKRFDEKGLEAPIPEAWASFEKKSFAEYEKCREAARKLLREGKKDEAVKLLNGKTASIWKEAATLMGLDGKEAPKNAGKK